VAGGCYVSNGADHPATFLHGHRAIRFGNAISRRAGDCNGDYTCVFRNVDLGALPAEIQPVDIRVLRHDRRAPEYVEALSSCRIAAGERLACTGAIHGDGFTMLVISEDMAERVPPHAFEGVLAGGFTDNARAEADLRTPRRRW
jgi:colicin import membrane protein